MDLLFLDLAAVLSSDHCFLLETLSSFGSPDEQFPDFAGLQISLLHWHQMLEIPENRI